MTQEELNNALATSVLHNNTEAIKSLINEGGEINSPCKKFNGNTPLILAVGLDNIEVTKLLLKNGANVNLKNDIGATALHIALTKYIFNDRIIEVLLEAGADINATNAMGKTPLDIAQEKPEHYNKIQEIIAKKSLTSKAKTDIVNDIIKTKNTPDTKLLSLLGNFEALQERLDDDYLKLKTSIEEADIDNCTHVAIRSIPQQYYNMSAPPTDKALEEQSLRAGFEYVENSVKSKEAYPAIAFSINPSQTPLLKTYAYQATDENILGRKHQRDAVIILPLPDERTISLLDKWKSLKKYVKEEESLKDREKILELISDKLDGLTYISAAYQQDAYSSYSYKNGKIKISSNDDEVDLSSLFKDRDTVGHSEVFIKLRGVHPKIYLVKLDVPKQDRDKSSGMFAGSFKITSRFQDLKILRTIASSSKKPEMVGPHTSRAQTSRSPSPAGRNT
ncbi:MAG: ankyrin repeat domain-containing protein [Rickettsiales bacterium]|nr:ankyrin repeat domain-containing protein [Rickettsiales bacterium]